MALIQEDRCPYEKRRETHGEKACGKRDGVIDAVIDAAASQ